MMTSVTKVRLGTVKLIHIYHLLRIITNAATSQQHVYIVRCKVSALQTKELATNTNNTNKITPNPNHNPNPNCQPYRVGQCRTKFVRHCPTAPLYLRNG